VQAVLEPKNLQQEGATVCKDLLNLVGFFGGASWCSPAGDRVLLQLLHAGATLLSAHGFLASKTKCKAMAHERLTITV